MEKVEPIANTAVGQIKVDISTVASGQSSIDESSSGSGATTPIQKRRRQASGFGVNVLPGKRIMKGFPLSKRDMEDLLSAGKESNRAYGFAGTSFGVFATLLKQIVSDSKTDTGWIAFCILALGLAVYFAWEGRSKFDSGTARLKEIEDQTKHDED